MHLVKAENMDLSAYHDPASLMLQAENEAAVQQIKRMKLEHAHTQQRFAEEHARLQRGIAQRQVAASEINTPILSMVYTLSHS